MTTEHERPTAGGASEPAVPPRRDDRRHRAGLHRAPVGGRGAARQADHPAGSPRPAGGPRHPTGRHVRRGPPPLPEPVAVAVFAADHGVHAQGVSPWPQEVTAQMVGNLAAGGGWSRALARQVGASVRVVDVGVAADLPDTPRLGAQGGPRDRRHDHRTGHDLAEVTQAVEVGITVARDLVARRRTAARHRRHGHREHHGLGRPRQRSHRRLGPAAVTGRGTGVDDAGLAHKVAVVRRRSPSTTPGREEPLRCWRPSAASSTPLSPASCGRRAATHARRARRGDCRRLRPWSPVPWPRGRRLLGRGAPLGRARGVRSARTAGAQAAGRSRAAPGGGLRRRPRRAAGAGGRPGPARGRDLRLGRCDRQG